MRPPVPSDEQERIKDLYRLDILDSEPEPFFDRITGLAAKVIGSPISLVSLVDRQRQWSKSRVGLKAKESPREIAFCSYAILENEPLVVLDAGTDDRFRDNPLVTESPKIRFYAGAPLRRAGGSALGTLCVIDTEPHESFSEAQSAILTELAALVTGEMEDRLALRLRDVSRGRQEKNEGVRRKLQESLRQAQSLFIGGAENDGVFCGLIERITLATGSKAGCIADLAPEGQLQVCASAGEHELLPLMRGAFTSGAIVRAGQSLALPAFNGREIAGVIGLAQHNLGDDFQISLEMDPFLDSVAGLFVASRARREGRKAASAIRVRDRALAAITSAVSIVDPVPAGGAILYANAAFESMAGYRADEVIGKPFGLMNGAETDPATITLTEDALASGEPLDTTLRSYHRDGTAFWNRMRLSPVRDKTGRVEYFVSVADDVTEKIAADNELLRARKEAEKNAQLTTRFMANMSHEIRTPMNGVIGMTGLLIETNLTEEQRDYAETIRSCGEGLLAVINEILDFSRIDSGSVQLEAIEFDISQCIESALDLVAASAARKSIGLEYLLDPGIPRTVIGDLTRLRQVLINLLGNAVKFTSEGEVQLSVSASRLADGRWEVHFAVRDTGIGIPPAGIDDIFKPFQQADNSTTRRFEGTGLGLSISRNLVELMGGRISVESEAGRGSTFRFTICVEAGKTTEPRDPALHMLALDGRRVVVIDSNPASQSILKQHLEAWGMHPRIYPSLKEATAARDPIGFDLAIIDNDLPGLSLDQITKVCGDIPLLVLCSVGRRNSGLSQELRGLSSPHARLHSKPIKPSYLCETLTSFLSGEPLLVAKPARPSISDPEFAVRLPFAVLVVEDNPVNQKLVLLLLSRMGYRAEAVNNGLEAISALQRRRYDVVFMDMHMPEMDGLDATRRIRKLLPEKEQPWIIALTANAMQADRKACLEAGMQDFVIKPVQTADLRSALLNVRQEHTVQIADAGLVLCEEWTMPDYLDELVTEDPALRTELLEVFASDTRRQISELQDAVSRSDLEKAKILLHGLKGSCAQMGASGIARRCAGMEVDIESSTRTDMEHRVSELNKRHDQLIVQMTSGLGLSGESAGSRPPVNGANEH